MSKGELQKVDMQSPVPRYIQAKAILAEAIRKGEFPPGTKLPSTSEIGAKVNVSLITAHKAIHCLVEEGWLRRERGRGTFVRDDFEASVAAKPHFRIALILQPTNVADDFYHGSLMMGLRKAASEGNPVGELVIQRQSTPEDLQAIHADGFLCFHPSREQFEKLEAAAEGRPVVVLGASLNDTSLYCVDSHNADGVRKAARHLIGLGHQRIAIINGPLHSTNCLHRFEGYMAEMKANRLPTPEEFIFNAETAQSAQAILDRLKVVMQGQYRPTAIISCGFYLSLEVMYLLRELNLSIPGDVSLVGFDDPKMTNLLNPPLTTVRQPLEEMGQRAYERVVQLVHGERPTPRVELLPTSLVVRGTTGPARA